jgi:hypothetical protein
MNTDLPRNSAARESNDNQDSADISRPDSVTPQQLSDNEQAQQDAYRRAYLEQLRQRAFPGCGDDDPIY